MIVEIEARDRRVRRNRVDAALASRAEQLQRRVHVQLRIVELRDRRRRAQVAAVDDHRVIVRRRDAAVMHDVLVQLHAHQPVIGVRVQLRAFGRARLQAKERLRHRHLIDEDLTLGERRLRNAVARLDDRRLRRLRRRRDARGAREEATDVDRVRRFVGALIDHLQRIVAADQRGRHLNAARSPAERQRHLARRERHLIARHRDRLEQRAADHPLRLLVEVREVVAFGGVRVGRGGRAMVGRVHRDSSVCVSARSARAGAFSCAFAPAPAPACAACPARRRRTSSSSDWKST